MEIATFAFGTTLSICFGWCLQLVFGSFFQSDYIITKPTDNVHVHNAKAGLMIALSSVASWFAIVRPLGLA